MDTWWATVGVCIGQHDLIGHGQIIMLHGHHAASTPRLFSAAYRQIGD